MIFAIAAISLNLILGYGGMVSFGHAAYLGIGAYAVGVLALLRHPQRLAAVGRRDRRLGAGRARDRRDLGAHQRHLLHHDHARLHADALLPRHLARRNTAATTACGSSVRSQFSGLIDLNDPIVVLLPRARDPGAARCYLVHRLVNSRFGLVLQAARSNEARTRAIGFSPYPYRLAAFVISGAHVRPRRRAAASTTPRTSRPSS